jgi:glycine cleavage system H protein
VIVTGDRDAGHHHRPPLGDTLVYVRVAVQYAGDVLDALESGDGGPGQRRGIGSRPQLEYRPAGFLSSHSGDSAFLPVAGAAGWSCRPPGRSPSLDFPTNLKYTKSHEWIRAEGTIAYVGITEWAQRELGDIVFVDVPTVGKTIEADEPFGTIEAVKTVSDLYMPVTGQVTEVNEELDGNPEIVNSDPYDDGWIIKIKMSRPDDLKDLLTAKQYKALIE